jgi:hypothetical protein
MAEIIDLGARCRSSRSADCVPFSDGREGYEPVVSERGRRCIGCGADDLTGGFDRIGDPLHWVCADLCSGCTCDRVAAAFRLDEAPA